MKDNFSSHSEDYSRYRPQYPEEVYGFLRSKLKKTGNAWDCGTGNGQVAGELAKFFERVEATDISSNQLQNAVMKDNIHYSVQPAEKTDFPNAHFDLIVSAQAVHWFDFDKFYSEVKRCLKPDGLIAILGYGLFSGNAATDKLINHFYKNIVGEYWDEERRYLEENYQSIPFPFQEIEAPNIYNSYEWEFHELLGYLRTWSAVKHYQKANNEDPVNLIENELKNAFGKSGQVVFPILFRLGKLPDAV